MVAAIHFFWYTSSDILIHKSYPIGSLILSKAIQACQLSLMYIMVLKNPGWMSNCKEKEFVHDPRNDKVEGYLSTCSGCKVISKRAVHCMRCGVCFEKIDHHCPWMNTCVANGNLCEFYAFICLTFSALFYALFLTVF